MLLTLYTDIVTIKYGVCTVTLSEHYISSKTQGKKMLVSDNLNRSINCYDISIIQSH